MEDIKDFKQAEDEQYVTLNEEVYKAELAEREARKKQREEARKKDRKNTKDNPDLILEESEQLIADMLTVKKK
jgi:hypothetical protein